MDYDERLKTLNLILPAAPKPAGSYVPAVAFDGFAYLSGQLSRTADGIVLTGKVGRDIDKTSGQLAARAAALNVLSVIRNIVGFDHFLRMVNVVCFIQTAEDFYDLAQVANGASDLLIEVLGDAGVHTRTTVGAKTLPLNAAVELEVMIQIKKRN